MELAGDTVCRPPLLTVPTRCGDNGVCDEDALVGFLAGRVSKGETCSSRAGLGRVVAVLVATVTGCLRVVVDDADGTDIICGREEGAVDVTGG